LHENGLYHNDLHERNVMLQNVYSDEDETIPVIIDFESLTFGEPLNSSRDEGSDFHIVENYRSLTFSREANKSIDLNRKLHNEIKSLIDRLGQEKWGNKKEEIIDSISTEEISSADDLYIELSKFSDLRIHDNLKIDLISDLLIDNNGLQEIFFDEESNPFQLSFRNKVKDIINVKENEN
jgi:hypothetical protein